MKTSAFVPTVLVDFNVSPTSGKKELADVILSSDFQQRLAAMLSEFDAIAPSGGDDGAPRYVPLTQKSQLLEKHFPLFTLTIGNQFVNIGEPNVICHSTFYVLTDEGYLPWFSRMGMADGDRVSSDGAMADAEISAKRRLFAALGMGADMVEDVGVVSKDSYVEVVSNYVEASGTKDIDGLISEYRRECGRHGLKPLMVRNTTKVDVKGMHEDDLELLAVYIAKKESNPTVFGGVK